jgi:hypothetical protein
MITRIVKFCCDDGMQTHRLSDRSHRVLQLEESIDDIRPLCVTYDNHVKRRLDIQAFRNTQSQKNERCVNRVRKLKLTASALN